MRILVATDGSPHARRAAEVTLRFEGLEQAGGLVLGSVNERVLHAAHGPVLIVR